MTSTQGMILAVIVIYLIAMILIGVLFNSRGSGSSSNEFFIGGRKLGPLVTAMSAEASDMSSYLLMGLPGLAYFAGIAEVGWTAIGLGIGTYLNWLLVARLLRRYSDKIGAFTIPDFFSRRYGDKRHMLACIAALVIIIFFVPYTASGFKAVGTLFNTLFGFNYHTAMIVGAVVIIGYTTLGGFLAVSTTDLIQSIFMTIALVVVVFFGISQAGGFDAVMKNANSLPGYFDLFGGYDMATNTGSHYGFLAIVSTMAWGLGYFGMPHILLRFMAIRNEKELVTSRRIASVWVFLSMGIAVFIGIIGNALSSQGIVQQLTTGSDAETIIIKMADLMGTKRLLYDPYGRYHHGRYPCRDNVHGGFSAARGCVQRIAGPSAGFLRHQAQPKGIHARGPSDGHRYCGPRSISGVEPEQLGLPGHLLRMGRLWCYFRTHHADRALLETLQ